MNILTVPGIGGSPPDHWQTRWVRNHPQVSAGFVPSSWDAPDPTDWLSALAAAVEDLGPQTVIVAHSLGCLAVAEYASRSGGFRGAVLVAPPDVTSPAFPAAAAAFTGLAYAPMTVPALVVASSNDELCSPAAAARLAQTWGADLIDAGPQGHLNAASGLGDWQWGWYAVQGFAATLHGRPEDEAVAS